MADIVLDQEATPTTPSAGTGLLFFDSSNATFGRKAPDGTYRGLAENNGVALQAAYTADTYITNSDLRLPSFSMQAGMTFIWELPVNKTGIGTATPVYTVRIGANRSTADTSRLAITGSAQTAVTDIGFIRIMVTCRNVGAAGVLQGFVHLQHNLAATGLASTPAGMNFVEATSASFDNSALGGQYVGLSINPGASGSWTHAQLMGRMYY